MVNVEEIRQWWNRKIVNYIQNYARRNKLTIAKAKEKFFTESHEKIIEVVSHELKKLIDRIHEQNWPPKWMVIDA